MSDWFGVLLRSHKNNANFLNITERQEVVGMNHWKLSSSLLTIAALSSANVAYAAEGRPGGFRLGPVSVLPSLGVVIQNDDNIHLNKNNISAMNMVISPAVAFAVFNKTDRYYLTYQADIGRYDTSGTDDYEDMSLGLGGEIGFSRRARLHLKADYLDGHDAVGQTNLFTNMPSQWHSYGASGTFMYGSKGARAGITANAGHMVKRYDTNTVVTSPGNFDAVDYGLGFSYRLAGKTFAMINLKAVDSDYIHVKSDQDNVTTTATVGLRWDVTGKTTGSVNVGTQERKFADTTKRTDYTGSYWDARIDWSPVSHATLSLFMGQNGTDDAVTDTLVSQHIGVDWNHSWSSRVTTLIGAQTVASTFEGGLESGRSDDLNNMHAKVNYQMRRWLKLGLGVDSNHRTSSDARYDYDRNVVSLTMKASM